MMVYPSAVNISKDKETSKQFLGTIISIIGKLDKLSRLGVPSEVQIACLNCAWELEECE